jgi:CRISPR-associated protein Csy2
VIVLIPRLEIQSTNAMVGQHFIATTPIMAASLMGHALGRTLGQQPTAIAWLHHTAQLLGAGDDAYGRFQPQQRRGAVFIDDSDYSSKNKHALSLQPTVSAHMTASLVCRFAQSVRPDDVTRFLRLARVAGGTVRQFGEVQVFDDEADLLKALPGGGYWLVERSDLVDPAQPLDSLLTALAHRPSSVTAAATADSAPSTAATEAEPAPVSAADIDLDDDEDDLSPMTDWPSEDESAPAPTDATPPIVARMSWLAPAVLGYAMTTEPAHRAGVRGDHEHAFAEPLIGLVQFVSQRQHTGPVPWWRHGWSADDVFLVTQDERLLDTTLNQADPQTNQGEP